MTYSYTLQSDYFLFESAEYAAAGTLQDGAHELRLERSILSGPSELKSGPVEAMLVNALVKRSDGSDIRVHACALEGTVQPGAEAGEASLKLGEHGLVVIAIEPPLADDEPPVNVWVAWPDTTLNIPFGSESPFSVRGRVTLMLKAGRYMAGVAHESANRQHFEVEHGSSETRSVTLRRSGPGSAG